MSVKTVLGDAEVLHAIKSGGMGDVLLARRRGAGDFEQLCAIKTIRGELAAAPVARTMFLDEAKLLARLTHPSIAQILGFGEQDGTLYMMMEYVPGEHFRRFRDRRPPSPRTRSPPAAAGRGTAGSARPGRTPSSCRASRPARRTRGSARSTGA